MVETTYMSTNAMNGLLFSLKKELNSNTTWMNLEYAMLKEITSHKIYDSTNIPRIVKLFTGNGGFLLRIMKNGCLLFNDYRVSVWKDEKVVERQIAMVVQCGKCT